MPIYEYRCQKCQFEFDKLVSLRDPNPKCPREVPAPKGGTELCQGPTEKKVSRGSFVLKGGGWFKDGY